MKKLLMTLVFTLVTLLSLSAKCDWNTLKLQQWNERNYYKWYVSGKILDDTCVNYMFMVYDFQTKKTDTIQDIRGIVEVQFNVKGKYKLYLKVWNRCLKCDTVLYRPIEIVQFPNAGLGWSVYPNSCKQYKFEMNFIKGMTVKDTCMEYYLMFYKGPWMDTMSQKEWDGLTDYQIGMEYDFPDDDFLGYGNTRLFNFAFKDTGRVLVIAQWWNKCLKQDTFMFRRLDVCKSLPTNSILKISKNNLLLTPNPAKDKVMVCNVSNLKTPFTFYTMYNSQGQLIKSAPIKSCLEVNVQDLPNGMYVIKIGNSTQRLIIQK
jgi:hypothetical protein